MAIHATKPTRIAAQSGVPAATKKRPSEQN
jgi:hypothetical protein